MKQMATLYKENIFVFCEPTNHCVNFLKLKILKIALRYTSLVIGLDALGNLYTIKTEDI